MQVCLSTTSHLCDKYPKSMPWFIYFIRFLHLGISVFILRTEYIHVFICISQILLLALTLYHESVILIIFKHRNSFNRDTGHGDYDCLSSEVFAWSVGEIIFGYYGINVIILEWEY